MIEKYHNPIYALIKEKGPLGVNSIATGTNIPLSTLQKYLTSQQTYFRKNEDRRWDLPENVKSNITDNSLNLAVNMVENTLLLLKSHLEETQQVLDTALTPISTIKRGISTRSTPVADKSADIHPKLKETDNKLRDTYVVLKKYVDKAPEEYQSLLKNVDLYDMTVHLGIDYMNDLFFPDITSLLLEQTTELSDETIDNLNKYQIE